MKYLLWHWNSTITFRAGGLPVSTFLDSVQWNRHSLSCIRDMDFSCNYGLLIWCSLSQTNRISTLSLGWQHSLSPLLGGNWSGREKTIEKSARSCELCLYLIFEELSFSRWRNVCLPLISQSCWKKPTKTAVFKHIITGHWIAMREFVPFHPLPPTHPGKLARNGAHSLFFCAFFPRSSLLSVKQVWSLGNMLSYFSCRGVFKVKLLVTFRVLNS